VASNFRMLLLDQRNENSLYDHARYNKIKLQKYTNKITPCRDGYIIPTDGYYFNFGFLSQQQQQPITGGTEFFSQSSSLQLGYNWYYISPTEFIYFGSTNRELDSPVELLDDIIEFMETGKVRQYVSFVGDNHKESERVKLIKHIATIEPDLALVLA
jgi:hypothetical protein